MNPPQVIALARLSLWTTIRQKRQTFGFGFVLHGATDSCTELLYEGRDHPYGRSRQPIGPITGPHRHENHGLRCVHEISQRAPRTMPVLRSSASLAAGCLVLPLCVVPLPGKIARSSFMPTACVLPCGTLQSIADRRVRTRYRSQQGWYYGHKKVDGVEAVSYLLSEWRKELYSVP